MTEVIDIDQLEPLDEDDEDERPLLVCGFTFGEILVGANALISFCLAYMALFGRSAQRYGGKSFVDSCFEEYFKDGDIFPAVLHPNVFAPFMGYVLSRFFTEAAATSGGASVMDSLFVLYAGITLSALLESGRRNVVDGFGWRGKILAALFPLMCQLVGICVVYPMFLLWMWKTRRSLPKRRKLDHMPSYDVDPRRVFLACACSLSILGLQFLTVRSGIEPAGREFTPMQAISFLSIPMVPAFLISFLPTSPEPSSSRTRLFAGVASLACFLIVGAAGFGIHSFAFSHFENELKTNGGQSMVDLVVKDALSSAPSRFLLVELAHLEAACSLFCAFEMSGTGGVGLVIFVTALVGPAGSFGLLAAHHEFRMMREDGLI